MLQDYYVIYSNRVCLKLFSYQLASTGVLWTCTTFQIHMGLLFISHLGSGTINNVISRKSSRSNICDSTDYALPPSRSQIRRGIEEKTSYSHMNWQPQTLRDEKKAIPSGLRSMMQLAIQEPCGQSIAWGTSIARGI